MPSSRAARCALSRTHIASRKIVLTAHFFSLVLDVTICPPFLLLYASTCHSVPLPGIISQRNLHLAQHLLFNHFRCLYVCAHPPPIASSSLHAARRHLSSGTSDNRTHSLFRPPCKRILTVGRPKQSILPKSARNAYIYSASTRTTHP